jgi:hypothetical protein
MAFVWNVLYAGQWWYFAVYENASLELGICVVALSITSFAYASILGADLLRRVATVHESTIKRLMNTVGVLVGLGWEKAIHIALVTVSSAAVEKSPTTKFLTHDKDTATLVFTLILCIIVLPAWRWYLLPAYLELADWADELEEEGLDTELYSHGEVESVEDEAIYEA